MMRESGSRIKSPCARGHNNVVLHGTDFTGEAGTDSLCFHYIAKQSNVDNRGKELARALVDAGRSLSQKADAKFR